MSLAAVLDTLDVDDPRAESFPLIEGSLEGSAPSLEDLTRLVSEYADRFAGGFTGIGQLELAGQVAGIEELSRTVEYLQVLAATAIDRSSATAGGRPAEGDTSRTGTCTRGSGFVFNVPAGERSIYRCTAEYLQETLRISRSEANRRLRLGGKLIPRTTLTGEPLPAPLEHLAAGVTTSAVSSRAATMISNALDRAQFVADTTVLDTMEAQLTTSATEYDPDFLTRLIRRWEAHLDPDGTEPTTAELSTRQGVFLRGKKRGLHLLDIAATDEQYETLTTVMNTTTNPRLPGASSAHNGGSGGVSSTDTACRTNNGGNSIENDDDIPESRSRAQLLLDGLIGACQVALATDTLPATGGHRPQILVTIDYQTLLNGIDDATTSTGTSTRTGTYPYLAPPHDSITTTGASFSFAGPINARTARKIACDAAIIPVVLGSNGEILDLGRTQRLFTPKQRKALLARDKGCTFPGCHMPGHWTEAHHIQPWSHGGTTNTDNGVLLCSHHHHLIHQGGWSIHIRHHQPWFTPPTHIDPQRKPRRNRYWTLC